MSKVATNRAGPTDLIQSKSALTEHGNGHGHGHDHDGGG